MSHLNPGRDLSATVPDNHLFAEQLIEFQFRDGEKVDDLKNSYRVDEKNGYEPHYLPPPPGMPEREPFPEHGPDKQYGKTCHQSSSEQRYVRQEVRHVRTIACSEHDMRGMNGNNEGTGFMCGSSCTAILACIEMKSVQHYGTSSITPLATDGFF